MDVTVNTAALLATMKANRLAHSNKYDKAMVRHGKQVRRECLDIASRIADGKKWVMEDLFTLRKPISYVHHYTTAIQMLKAHTEDTVTLQDFEFERYQNDNWDWSHDFMTTNRMYNVR